MTKTMVGIVAVIVLVVAAFAAGWYAHGPQTTEQAATQAPAAMTTGTSPKTQATQTKDTLTSAPASESTDLYTVTSNGTTKTVSSAKLQISFVIPSTWTAGANAAESGINLAPPRQGLPGVAPSSVAVMTIYGAAADPYSDPKFIDGTSVGFIAILALPDGKEVDIGKSVYDKLKTASIGGHDAALVAEPNGDQVTWVRYDGLNWYIVEKAAIGTAGRTASQIIASIKLK